MQELTLSSRWFAATLSSQALVTSLSSGAEQFIGRPAMELIGRPITQILSDQSVFEFQCILDTAKGRGFWRGKISHQLPGSHPLEAQCLLVQLANPEDHSSGYLLISDFDTSPNTADCEDMFKAEVGADLRAFAHEINNPLAVAMGFAQLLMFNTNCSKNMKTDIEKLYSELQRVVRIVERFHQYGVSLCDKSFERPVAVSL